MLTPASENKPKTPEAETETEIGSYITYIQDNLRELTIAVASLEQRLEIAISHSETTTPPGDVETNTKTHLGAILQTWNTEIRGLRHRLGDLYSRIELPRT